MNHLHTEEAREKARKTKEGSLPQMSDPMERETHIIVNYPEDNIWIYTNHATVMNRMDRVGYEYKSEEYLDGQVYSRRYEFPMKMLAKFATSTLFK